MTYWADNIRFIKEVQDSKYLKVEEAIDKVSFGINQTHTTLEKE